MRVGIELSKNAYTPEAHAYEKYLSSKGHNIELNYVLNANNDINIHFMGIRPFWQPTYGTALEIHEYHSLSTGSNPKIKNCLKRYLNNKPKGYIFLNELVHKDLGFKNDIPYIYRDMGIDNELFQAPSVKPKYDVVYCGSISGRVGLLETLLQLSKNLKICVVGSITEHDKEILDKSNITLLGQKSRREIPSIYREARYGLNYTPDIYPYNIQTSTKTIEYLAAGLHVISNRYKWIEGFCKKHSYEPIWLDTLYKDLSNKYVKNLPDMSEYKWNNVLENCKLELFLKTVLEKSND